MHLQRCFDSGTATGATEEPRRSQMKPRRRADSVSGPEIVLGRHHIGNLDDMAIDTQGKPDEDPSGT